MIKWDDPEPSPAAKDSGMSRDEVLALAKNRWSEVSDRTFYINTSLMVWEAADGRVELESVDGMDGILAWGYNSKIDKLAVITVN